VFDKIFRTKHERIGGIGKVTLPDGTKRKIYLHINFKKNITINDSSNYKLSGKIMPLRNPFTNTTNFSFYLWSRGIRYHTSYAKLTLESEQSKSFLQKQRKIFSDALDLFDLNISSIYKAILMGKKEMLTQDQLQHFFYTGTMHLFAVSGLHVGVVSTFLFFLCRLLWLPRFFCILINAIGVLFYATIVGFSPSTLRASIMVFFILCAQILSRPIDAKSAFFNTVGTTLFFNPFELWDVGFQLSYGVVASILYMGIPLTSLFNRNINRLSSLKSSYIISFSASIMSSIFSIYYWEMFTPWAFLANLFLIPIASFVVILGITAWITYPLTITLHTWINYVAHKCISLLLLSVKYLGKLPWAYLKIRINAFIFLTMLFIFLLFVVNPPKSFKVDMKN